MPSEKARQPGNPTAHDVARLAGVSQSAVSRAFTPSASIAELTRARVMAAAETLGYRPNLLARSLITGQSKIVGIGVGDLENAFFSLALGALTSRLSAAGYRVLLFTAPQGAKDDEVDPRVEELLHYQVDAMILLAASLSSELAERCRQAGIPVVFFNRTGKGLAATCSVTGDNQSGGAEIARFLLQSGRRRPAFVAGLAASSTSVEREQGFMAVLREAGVDPLRESGDFTRAGAAAATRRLVGGPDRPDAIFCANDHMAFAAIDVVRSEFGLRVGQDIAIVGFDDVPLAASPAYSLTTFSQPIAPMADAAVDFALRQEPAEEMHLIIRGELIVRSSAPR
jgi:DNA-binding LacI/PurR family transcriptional regulator